MSSPFSDPLDRAMDIDVAQGKKRGNINIYHDIMNSLPDPKRPRQEMDMIKKTKVLKSIIEGYQSIFRLFFSDVTDLTLIASLKESLSIGYRITRIILTQHNTSRQSVSSPIINMIKKTATKQYTTISVTFDNKAYTTQKDKVKAEWDYITSANELNYNMFRKGDTENWYETMESFLNLFLAFRFRVKELMMGHGSMLIGMEGKTSIRVQVSKYGLSEAHHVLLEGCNFPPESRYSMVDSIGPMTVFLCMLRSDEPYRDKWEAAVKRTMSHIAGIDDIIILARSTNKGKEFAPIISILANILLITTSRQVNKMCFPINLVVDVYSRENDKKAYLENFDVSDKGGFYTYKKACDYTYNMSGSMTSETAAQIMFHAIFGTCKEDLSVLSQITNCVNWESRAQMGNCFSKPRESRQVVSFRPIKMKFYSKLASENQSDLLSGEYSQVSSVPAFSEMRNRISFIDDTYSIENFFHCLEKTIVQQITGKTIPQLISILSEVLKGLVDRLGANECSIQLETRKWRCVESLSLLEHGVETDLIVPGYNKFF